MPESNQNSENIIFIAGADEPVQDLIRKTLTQYNLIFSEEVRGINAIGGIPELMVISASADFDSVWKAFRNDYKRNHIPVILLCTQNDLGRINTLSESISDILIQPFSPEELAARISLRIFKNKRNFGIQLHNIFQQAPVAFSFFREPDHVVEAINRRMLDIWGKELSQVIGKPLFEGMPEARNQGYESLLDGVLQTGERYVAEELPVELFRNGKMEKVFVKFVFEPVYDEYGERSGIITVADEITQQVENRKKIEISETRYKLAIEAAEMGNFEWIIPTSEFIYSERLAEIFGYNSPAGLNHESFSKLIHPEDRGLRLDAHRAAMQSGTLFYEARIITPEDELRWIRLRGKIIYEDDMPFKMYGTVLDITEHKNFSESLEKVVEERTKSLRLSEERNLRMIDEVQDYAILLLDPNGTIMNWNRGAEKIKGYKDSDIIGKNFNIFYGDEDRRSGLPQKLIHQAVETGRAVNEGYRVRKDGTRFWASVSITALHDSIGNIIGFSKVTRDLTERKESEDKMMKYNLELEAQNKELEQFAYVASHDLQEPLRKIQMFSDLLRQNTDDKHLTEKYFEKISMSANRMTELIRAVLNYSRLSRNEQQFESVDLKSVINDVLIDFELLIEEKNAKVTCDELPVIDAVPLQIGQLFSNLIGNALKFSVNNPEIKIAGRILHYNNIEFVTNLIPGIEYIEITVSDNGIGFDEQYLGWIFTIFHRLNDKSAYTGTGIGLALCKKIVDNHSGYITARSAVGEGATFYIYMPVRHPENPVKKDNLLQG